MRDTTHSLPELMTVQEVATSLRESKVSVYRKIRRGDLPAVRLVPHGALRVDSAELGDYLERRRTTREDTT